MVCLSKLWVESGTEHLTCPPYYHEEYRMCGNMSLFETAPDAAARRGYLALTSMLLARKEDKNDRTGRNRS